MNTLQFYLEVIYWSNFKLDRSANRRYINLHAMHIKGNVCFLRLWHFSINLSSENCIQTLLFRFYVQTFHSHLRVRLWRITKWNLLLDRYLALWKIDKKIITMVKPSYHERLYNKLLVDALEYLEKDANKDKNKRTFKGNLKLYFKTPSQRGIDDVNYIFEEMRRIGFQTSHWQLWTFIDCYSRDWWRIDKEDTWNGQ